MTEKKRKRPPKKLKKKRKSREWRPANFRPIDDETAAKLAIAPKPIGRPIEWTEQAIEDERVLFEKWLLNQKNYYFQVFYNDRDLSYETIEMFSRRSPAFLETMKKARAIQEQRLVTLALERKHDGNFTKFVLANRAGWKERTELSGSAANPLAFILAAVDGTSKDLVQDTTQIPDIDVTPDEPTESGAK